MVRVLVAGGGIAALELVVALRKLAGELVTIELLAPGDELVYQPLLVAEPFGAGAPHRFPLGELLSELDAARTAGSLAELHAGAHEALTDGGTTLQYDALALVIGARCVPAVPGALTFGEPADVAPFRELLGRLERGELRRVAFALPDETRTWPLPLYELALMTAAHAPGAEVALVTPEPAPLVLFGAAGSEAVSARLAAAGIELHTGASPEAFEAGGLRLSAGGSLPADAVVAVPCLEVPPLAGVPQGEHGFVPVDQLGRVAGLADVYAAGDVTDFPVKQGGVAVRQAQAVASCIAAQAGAPVAPEPFEPVLRGMMLTGAAPSYLESAAGESQSADSPLWWPPTKIADSYLVPYLLTRFQLAVTPAGGERLVDLVSSAPAGEDVPARPGRHA
jgi:sulfide:quinone oxidoreductase